MSDPKQDPDPKKIVSDPQHCVQVQVKFRGQAAMCIELLVL
jgi:hypothetical protein